MTTTGSKLSIIGAGAVGSSLAYAAMIRGSAREIVLYDIDAARAEAEVLDLGHGSPIAGSSQVYGGGDLDAVAGSQVVIVTAGAKQKPGQSRLELAGVNVGILRSIMPGLVQRAPDAIYVIVTNPCDVLAVAAQRFGGLDPARVFASGTVLDSTRLRWLLADRLRVAPQSVHAMMVGEHGDTEFPLWSQAKVGPVPLSQWSPEGLSPFTEEEFAQIASDVVGAAYKVIAGKGATNYAIGLSGARIAEAILRDEHAVMPISRVLENYRGIDGVALSVPSIVGARGVIRSIDVPYDDDELELLQRSAETLKASIASLGIE